MEVVGDDMSRVVAKSEDCAVVWWLVMMGQVVAQSDGMVRWLVMIGQDVAQRETAGKIQPKIVLGNL